MPVEAASSPYHLRLPTRQWREMLELVEMEGPDPGWHAYHTEAAAEVRLMHPGGSQVELRVRCHRVSASGITFFHGSYAHDGTPCRITLTSYDRERVILSGKVARCSHLRAAVHVVVVNFDEPVDVSHYVEPGTTVTADPQAAASLTGCLLYVEDNPSDRELLKFHLRKDPVRIIEAGNLQEALHACKTQAPDLAAIDMWLGEESGLDVAQALRGMQFDKPLLALTADQSPDMAQRIAQAGFAEVLIKPYQPNALTSLLRKHLLAEPSEMGDLPLLSSRWDDAAMRPVIERFVGRLVETAAVIKHQLEKGNRRSARQRAMELKGSAESFGFSPISTAAQALLMALDAGDAPAIQAAVDGLEGLCRRAGMGVGKAA